MHFDIIKTKIGIKQIKRSNLSSIKWFPNDSKSILRQHSSNLQQKSISWYKNPKVKILKWHKATKFTGNLRTLAMASRRGRETSNESLPGSFPTGTPSFEILQNPSSLFLMSVWIRVLFSFSSFFFSDGYRLFPVLLPHRTSRVLNRGNEGFRMREFLRLGLGFEREGESEKGGNLEVRAAMSA